MELSNLKRDTSKVENGEWVDNIPLMGDLRLRVRGMSSKLYTTYISRLGRSVPPEGRNRDNTLKPDAAKEIMVKSISEHVLLDWDGITDDGQPVKFSKELALQWMNDPSYGPFLDAVIYAAGVIDNGREMVVKALEKN